MNQPHAFKPIGANRMYDWQHCAVCNLLSDHPLHILTLQGMDSTDADREAARQVQQAQDLTAELRRPLADVSAKAGKMEREAPLFFGTGTNPTLF
jgi:hypothetical protein